MEAQRISLDEVTRLLSPGLRGGPAKMTIVPQTKKKKTKYFVQHKHSTRVKETVGEIITARTKIGLVYSCSLPPPQVEIIVAQDKRTITIFKRWLFHQTSIKKLNNNNES